MVTTFPSKDKRRIRQNGEENSALAYDNAENGAIVFLSDDKRNRAGKREYKQYVDKVGGVFELADLSATYSGSGKGGLLWIDPNPESTNRSRLIFSYNNSILLYSVENDTTVVLRDVAKTDSATVVFLSGYQSKKSGYLAVGDSTLTNTLFKYTGTSTGAITAFADYSGTVAGTVKATDVAHGLATGNTVAIAGTANYNATYVVTVIDADNFYFTATWVATETGTWSGETLAVVTTIGMNPARLLGRSENRLAAVGTGDNADNPQYSLADSGGTFSDFTPSAEVDGGGTFSGAEDNVVAIHWFRGQTYIFEEGRISPHRIKNLEVYDPVTAKRTKDTVTLDSLQVIDGIGIESPKAITEYNSNMYFISPKGLFEVSDDGLRELTKKFRPLMKKFDFNNSSIQVHEDRNILVITCGSQTDIADDFQLIWSFDTSTLSFVPDRFSNQLFWDKINKKLLGLGSTKPQVIEFYGDQYADEEENITLRAETAMNDMGNNSLKKRFVNLSIKVGAVNDTQVFDGEIFINDATEASVTFQRTMEDVIDTTSQGMTSWSDEAWSSGTPSAETPLGFVTIFWRGFVPRFEKISVVIKEDSPYRSVVYQPIIEYWFTGEKVNSFKSNY